MPMKVSHSRLSMWETCKYKWKIHYVDGMQSPPNENLITGDALHRTIANINAGTLTDKDIVAGCLQSAKDALERFPMSAIKAEDLADEVFRLVKAWHNFQGRNRPVRSEVEYMVPLRNPVTGEVDNDITLHAIIDAEMPDIDADTVHVGEYKSSSRAWDVSRVIREVQADFYALVKGRKNLVMDYEVVTKTKVPKVQQFRVKKTVDDQIAAFNRIKTYAEYQTTAWAQNPPKCKSMSCSWCDYYDICLGKAEKDVIQLA